MQGFTLMIAFNMAVRQVMIDHERCATYVKHGFSKRTGRKIKRPLKHVEVRLNIISNYLIYSGMNKQYKPEVYLTYGSGLR